MSRFKRFLGGALRALLPPQVKAVVGVVNRFLPADRQLLPDARPKEVEAAYEGLTPEQQEQVDREAEIELAEIQASADKLEAMVSVETAGSNVRPRVVQIFCWQLVANSLLAMGAIYSAIYLGDPEMLDRLTGSWEMVLALNALPAAVIRAYFGMRSREKKARYAAATGQDIGGAIGGVAQAVKSILGR